MRVMNIFPNNLQRAFSEHLSVLIRLSPPSNTLQEEAPEQSVFFAAIFLPLPLIKPNSLYFKPNDGLFIRKRDYVICK